MYLFSACMGKAAIQECTWTPWVRFLVATHAFFPSVVSILTYHQLLTTSSYHQLLIISIHVVTKIVMYMSYQCTIIIVAIREQLLHEYSCYSRAYMYYSYSTRMAVHVPPTTHRTTGHCDQHHAFTHVHRHLATFIRHVVFAYVLTDHHCHIAIKKCHHCCSLIDVACWHIYSINHSLIDVACWHIYSINHSLISVVTL